MKASYLPLLCALLATFCASTLADGPRHSLSHHSKPKPKKAVIYGKITWYGHPKKGVRVHAYDHDHWMKDTLLGEDTTDKEGNYKIAYDVKHYDYGFGKHKYPDVYIRAKHYKYAAKSKVYENTSPQEPLRINLELA